MNTSFARIALCSTLIFSSLAIHAQEAQTRKKVGPTGIVSVPYKLDNPGKEGYDSMTFTIRIDEAPNRKRSFYYAMQFKFINGNGGYIGIQPRGEDKGMAVFSMFGSGGVPVADNCRGGADGGHGVSCSKPFTIEFKNDYYLTVSRDKNDKALWHGSIKNVQTGEKIDIGSWKPKAGSKGLEGSNGGFVEYFPLIEDCSDIPNTKGFFGHPSAKTADGKHVSGKIGELKTYGRCKNIKFSTSQSNAGSSVTLSPQ